MENELSHITLSRIAAIRHRFAGHAVAIDDGAIRIVAAAQNWPELTSLSAGEVAIGDDGLIRLALWSASKCCATLLSARRALLLLPEGDGAWEIKCLVLANASLATPRPLSGFLLKPVECLDRRAPRDPHASRKLEDHQNHADETRLALFEAFPVGDVGKTSRLE
jgi:hypothetical protein